ncbi:protein unc-93 homolog A-like [Glandiceps talaboti]
MESRGTQTVEEVDENGIYDEINEAVDADAINRDSWVDRTWSTSKLAITEDDVDGSDDETSKMTKEERKQRKRRIIKNLLAISSSFLFLFTAFQALSNLQSSINCDEGLGIASLATIYVCMIISSLFISTTVIRHLGTKWSLAVSMSCYVLFTAANYYPQWYTLIPASVLVGFAAAPMWASKGVYLTTSSIRYANIAKEESQVIVNRFFGIFFLFFQNSQIWGNLISSLILGGSSDNANDTESGVTYTCGAKDCQETEGNETTYCNPPPRDLTNILLTAYLISGVVAIIIVIVLLDQLKGAAERKEEGKSQGNLFLSTVKMLKDYRMVFMIPLTCFSGFEQAFIAGDFTKSYVSCVIGVDMVGYVMICYGVSDALFSVSAGYIAKYIGRVSLVAIGAIVNLVLIIVLLLWEPQEDQTPIFFTIAAIWGLADAIWQTEITSVYGILFSDNQQAAYSNYRLWESIGFATSFAYSLFLCVYIKLYILVGCLTLGVLLYFIVEYKHWQKQKSEKQKK